MGISFLSILILLAGGLQSDKNLDEAIHLYGKGEFRRSVELLQQLKDASPDEPDVRLWLGKAYLKTRDWDSAIHEIERATQLQPENAHLYLWLGRACGARASHSFFATAFGWARRVLREFETARNLAPKDLDIRFDLLDFYLTAPSIIGGGKSKAEAEAEAIANLNPSKGYIARAIVLQKNKKWDQALKELMQGAAQYPAADAYKDLAIYLFYRKDYEGSLDWAKKALELDSESKESRLLVAASHIRLRSNLDRAAKILHRLAEGVLSDDDPSFEEVYYWLGECYLEAGDAEKAREAFKSALIFNPDYSEAKNGISRLKQFHNRSNGLRYR